MCVLVGEQRVVERALLALGDIAVRVGHIAERKRLGRTCGLAGRFDFADRTVLPIRRDARLRDALQAEGALLHHAASAHGDIGIARLRRALLLLRKREVIEAADLVGAVIGAEPRADAAVVHHHVQPLGIVHRRPHRADDLARRLLALHAQHRLEVARGRIGLAFIIAIDAQPLHLTLVDHLLLADDGNVVLGLAGDDARVATDARVQIDAHGPGRRPLGFPAIKLRLPFAAGEKARLLGVARE